eukprot:scaffold7360_cov103-Alexandrium_tamarense.AAC.1
MHQHPSGQTRNWHNQSATATASSNIIHHKHPTGCNFSPFVWISREGKFHSGTKDQARLPTNSGGRHTAKKGIVHPSSVEEGTHRKFTNMNSMY